MQQPPKRTRSTAEGATKVQPCTSPSEGNAARPYTSGNSGADWLTDALRARNLADPSPLGVIVADILGEVFSGIYHIRSQALFHQRTEWHADDRVELVIGSELANHDGSELTWLVLLCHAHRIRLSITAAGPRYLSLSFSAENGRMFLGRVPSVPEVFDRFSRTYYERGPAGAPEYTPSDDAGPARLEAVL